MLPAIGLDGRYLDPHHPGIGRYVWELARALPSALGDRHLFLLSRDDERPRSGRFDPSALTARGVRVVHHAGAPRAPWAPLRLRRRVRQLGVGLWHAPYFPTSFGPGCPRVVTVYDVIGVLDPSFLPSAGRRLLYRLALAAALRRAQRVITLSEAARGDLETRLGVPARRIAVTPAGVGDAFRPAARDEVARLRAAHGLPERYALYLGSDRPHKNLDRLLAAWRALHGAGRTAGWALALAGFPRPRERRRDGPGVIGLGPIAEPDLPALLSGAELLVMPSRAEGFGLPVLEAMACGTAVACARAAGLEETAGDAAALFDPTDVGAIADAIGRLMDDPATRRRLAADGRAHAARFTWRATARATAAVYEQVLSDAEP